MKVFAAHVKLNDYLNLWATTLRFVVFTQRRRWDSCTERPLSPLLFVILIFRHIYIHVPRNIGYL